MNKESKELLKKLDVLTEKIDILTTVTAISMQREELFEGKTKKEQIKNLAKMGLPRNIIALIVRTSPLTVSVTLSKMKSKKRKTKSKKQPKQEEVEQK